MLETEHGLVHPGRIEAHQLIRKLQETDHVQEQIQLQFSLETRFISLAVMEDITIKELLLMIYMLMT